MKLYAFMRNLIIRKQIVYEESSARKRAKQIGPISRSRIIIEIENYEGTCDESYHVPQRTTKKKQKKKNAATTPATVQTNYRR